MTPYTIKKKLTTSGFTPDEIKNAVDRLIEWGYLNDRSYSLTLIKSRKERQQSPRKIIAELMRAGIDKQLIAELMEEYYPHELERENCLTLAQTLQREEEKKWERKKQYQKQDPESESGEGLFQKNKSQDIAQKVRNKLLWRGFRATEVNSVVARLFGKEND